MGLEVAGSDDVVALFEFFWSDCRPKHHVPPTKDLQYLIDMYIEFWAKGPFQG